MPFPTRYKKINAQEVYQQSIEFEKQFIQRQHELEHQYQVSKKKKFPRKLFSFVTSTISFWVSLVILLILFSIIFL